MASLVVRSLTELEGLIAEARAQALRDAKQETEGMRYFPSRGIFLATANVEGQCGPAPEADCPVWDGRWKSIIELVRKVNAMNDLGHANVDKIYIGGGYDAAESPVAYRADDYMPWVASWEVVVWKRGS